MSNNVIEVRGLSKQYRLGEIGTGTLSHDINRWWAKIRGKEDPYSIVGKVNDRTSKASADYVWALKDINFNIKKGEVVGVIGRNGAGKSTLLKVLSKITGPTQGSIKMKGKVASLLEVGTGMHPELTARENIYLNGAILGMNRMEVAKKFDEIVDFAGVNLYVDTPVKRFSSGMKVRLGFAVAAHLEPEILIVDEVLAVGDVEFQNKAIGKIKNVSQGEGRTVLFVSHNMASVMNLCTRGILINNGKIEKDDKINDVVKAYLNLSSTSNTKNNLLELKDRKYSGKLKFSDWKMKLGINEQEIENAITGSPFYLEFYLESNNDIKDVYYAISFFSDTSKQYYTTLRSDCIGKKYNVVKGTNKIIFFFNELPLTQGSYSFNLSARTKHEILDNVNDAGSFNVVNGDYYRNGILPSSKRQGLLIDFNCI